ncbi:OpgC domain-containing protein [Aurantimonas aggregata]|uniref:OpgC domain-containing protein n=1 Tax=Aurantimonas aggregata TaxID=2047720 RepID=A0A6L9MKC2_9HYPH|nr:OpgC domain-containing protein [Aurantimonas aggregata]NDV88277.1 OpgC domain-containing protein [Aurantimonas aggregata]
MITSATPAIAVQTRDQRVDFWRGIALAMIFINHIPGNFWEDYTSRNFGFSDAAELFVFLAGFASAFAYGRLFLGGEKLIASLRAARRAGVLYLVHISLTMAAVAIFSWGALALGEGGLMRNIGLAQFIAMPLETMVGFASLGHQLGYVNILPMYSVLLLLLPLHLFLVGISRNIMLGAAVAMWFAAYLWRIDVPAYPLPGGWFFNPFAWQLIFAIGLYCGFRRVEGKASVPYRPWLFYAALAYVFASFLTIRLDLWWLWGAYPLPMILTGFDKTYVSLPRLLHILSICYLFANAAPSSPFSTVTRDNVFAMLGRHSLPVFAFGTVLSLFGQVIKHGQAPDFLFDTLLIGGGLFIQIALARYLDWWRVASQGVRPAFAAKPARLVPGHSPVPLRLPPQPAGAAMPRAESANPRTS